MNAQNEWPKRLEPRRLHHIRCLIFGAPGVGKTRLAATAPRPFFLGCDPEGTLSIVDSGHLYWEIHTMDDFRLAWAWLANNPDEYDTIVVDSVTTLKSIGFDEIVAPSVLSFPRTAWGKSTRQMQATFWGLCQFPKNLVFNATERLRDDELRHLKIVVPNLPPATARILCDYVRLIGRLSVERVEVDEQWVFQRRLVVANTGQVWAKDTSGRLPPEIVNPNLTEIFAAMQGAPDIGPDPQPLLDLETNES